MHELLPLCTVCHAPCQPKVVQYCIGAVDAAGDRGGPAGGGSGGACAAVSRPPRCLHRRFIATSLTGKELLRCGEGKGAAWVSAHGDVGVRGNADPRIPCTPSSQVQSSICIQNEEASTSRRLSKVHPAKTTSIFVYHIDHMAFYLINNSPSCIAACARWPPRAGPACAAIKAHSFRSLQRHCSAAQLPSPSPLH